MKKEGSSMSKLNPIIENGLLREGGRIRRVPVPYHVILPYKHHVTELIIREHHQGVGHSGISFVIPETEVLDSEREISCAQSPQQVY